MLFTTKITGLEAQVADLTSKLAAMTTERDNALAQIAQLQKDHTAALAAKDTEVQGRVEQGVTDGLAAGGVPESALPASGKGSAGAAGGGSSDYATAMGEYAAIEDAAGRAAFYASNIAPLLAGKN